MIFNNNLGNKFDNWLMNVTDRRWQKKMQQHRLNTSGRSMGMVVGPHVSKPDPKNFQDKVVKEYHNKVQQLLQENIRTASMIL
jgi:hypothetical protein